MQGGSANRGGRWRRLPHISLDLQNGWALSRRLADASPRERDSLAALFPLGVVRGLTSEATSQCSIAGGRRPSRFNANRLDLYRLRLYGLVRISPFGAPKIRAIKKAQKHYLFDWTQVPEMPLLKWVHYQHDAEGRDLELRYFRDIDGREVDFVVTESRKPIRFVEVKWADGPADTSLRYLKQRFPEVDAWQISATGTKDVLTEHGIRIAPAVRLLEGLA